MSKIQVLDCTLRDGGYINQWKFGTTNIEKIMGGLLEANIDIIECGFLTQKEEWIEGTSKFNTVEQIGNLLPKVRDGKMFVCMMNYGEYNIEELPQYDGTSIDGIRIAFHKNEMIKAFEMSYLIKDKGYNVFIQPMISMNYTDYEFLDLIYRSNKLEPYAFYIVDSFGVMKKRDLVRLYYLVEHNLMRTIQIGFHSHNNLQLSYSNAQALVEMQKNHELIIDASVLGMGRGAGNLNMELFVQYLNDVNGANYSVAPLLNIIDQVLNNIYSTQYWGYSLPNYLSAIHNCHPNYASYLDDKKTLTVNNINEIFAEFDLDKKNYYDKGYIDNLYNAYMNRGKINDEHLSNLREIFEDKSILLIAPGKTVESEKNRIIQMSQKNEVITIAINFDYNYVDTDYIFISNLRRFVDLDIKKKNKVIATSNILVDDVYMQLQYTELINDNSSVKDNAGMMAIKFLLQFKIEKILLAGFDGYSFDTTENYADDNMQIFSRKEVLDSMNKGMYEMLCKFSKNVKIEFLTTPHYINF